MAPKHQTLQPEFHTDSVGVIVVMELKPELPYTQVEALVLDPIYPRSSSIYNPNTLTLRVIYRNAAIVPWNQICNVASKVNFHAIHSSK